MSEEDSKTEGNQTQEKSVSHQEVVEEKRSNGGKEEIKKTQKSCFWDSWTTQEKTQIVFNGLLTLFTIIYAAVTVFQFVYIIEKDRLDQRAWVGISEYAVSDLQVGKAPVSDFRIVNSGNTPARKVETQLRGKSFPKGQEFSPIYPGEADPSSSMLQPHLSLRIFSPIKGLTQERINALRSGSETFYIYGKISYEDIFSRSYCGTFCTYLTPDLQIRSCPFYNDETDGPCNW